MPKAFDGMGVESAPLYQASSFASIDNGDHGPSQAAFGFVRLSPYWVSKMDSKESVSDELLTTPGTRALNGISYCNAVEGQGLNTLGKSECGECSVPKMRSE